MIEESGEICEITPNIMVTKDARVAAVVKGKESSDNQDSLRIGNKKQLGQIDKVPALL